MIKFLNRDEVTRHLKVPVVTVNDEDVNWEEPQSADFELDLPEGLLERLFPHQVAGVQWLYGIHCNPRYTGAILGDDMGLGKTFQTVAFLTGLFRTKELRQSRALIIAPVSVLATWQRELSTHLVPHVKRASVVVVSAEMAKTKRQQIIRDVFETRRPRVVITSYQLVANMVEDFAEADWDYVILDEGHCIKNPTTKMTKAMHALPSTHRLLLTGTPVQNHLQEFWCLLDWVTMGRIFGTKREFSTNFDKPIVAGQNPKATAMERQLASQANQRLTRLTRPILLQRKKSDAGMESLLKLPCKTELVVWIGLSTAQRHLYEAYLTTREAKTALSSKTYPIDVINHLKTLCRHPFLVEAAKAKKAAAAAAGNGDDDIDDLVKALGDVNLSEREGEGVDPDAHIGDGKSVFDIVGRYPNSRELLQGSTKLRVTVSLADRLVNAGHRVLIFSQSRLMCDILQRVLSEEGLASCRIDGSVTGKQRQRLIDYFNENKGRSAPPIALLTTRACGTGITLTGADRVIIHDPSWNPAEDKQAVDRAYRIGQARDVVVYRLISAGSVEEKMYEKQVFKDGVRVVLENGESSRYFSDSETRQLFVLGAQGKAEVMERLWRLAREEIWHWPDGDEDKGEVDSELVAMLNAAGVKPVADKAIRGVIGYSRHNLYNKDEKGREPEHKAGSGPAAAVTDGGAGGTKGSAICLDEIEEEGEGVDRDEATGVSLNESSASESSLELPVTKPWQGRDILGRPLVPNLPGIANMTSPIKGSGGAFIDLTSPNSPPPARSSNPRTPVLPLVPAATPRIDPVEAKAVVIESPGPDSWAQEGCDETASLPGGNETPSPLFFDAQSSGAAGDNVEENLLRDLAGLSIAPRPTQEVVEEEEKDEEEDEEVTRVVKGRKPRQILLSDSEDESGDSPRDAIPRNHLWIALSDNEEEVGGGALEATHVTNPRGVGRVSVGVSSFSGSEGSEIDASRNDNGGGDGDEAPWDKQNISAHWKDFRNPYEEDSDEQEEEEDQEQLSVGSFIVDDDDEGEQGEDGQDSIDVEFCGPDCKCDDEEEEDEDEDEDEEEDKEDEEGVGELHENGVGDGTDGERYLDNNDENAHVSSNAKSPAKSPVRSPKPAASSRSPLRDAANVLMTVDVSHHRPPLRAPKAIPLPFEERLMLCTEWGMVAPCGADTGSEPGSQKHLMHLSAEEVCEYNQYIASAAACITERENKGRRARREEAAALLCAALGEDLKLRSFFAFIPAVLTIFPLLYISLQSCATPIKMSTAVSLTI